MHLRLGSLSLKLISVNGCIGEGGAFDSKMATEKKGSPQTSTKFVRTLTFDPLSPTPQDAASCPLPLEMQPSLRFFSR